MSSPGRTSTPAGESGSDFEWTHIKKKGFTPPNSKNKRNNRATAKANSESQTSQDKPTKKKRARNPDTSDEVQDPPPKKARTTTTRVTRSSKRSDESKISQDKPASKKRVRISDTSEEILAPPPPKRARALRGMKIKAAKANRSSTDSQEAKVLKSALKKPAVLSGSDIEYEPTPKGRGRVSNPPQQSNKRSAPDSSDIEYEPQPKKRACRAKPPQLPRTPRRSRSSTNTQEVYDEGVKTSIPTKRVTRQAAAEQAQAEKDAKYAHWEKERDEVYERSFRHWYGFHTGDFCHVRTKDSPKWNGGRPVDARHKRVWRHYAGVLWKRKVNGLRKVDKSKIILTEKDEQAIIKAEEREEQSRQEFSKLEDERMVEYRKYLKDQWRKKKAREEELLVEPDPPSPWSPHSPWRPLPPFPDYMFDEERGVPYRRWPEDGGYN